MKRSAGVGQHGRHGGDPYDGAGGDADRKSWPFSNVYSGSQKPKAAAEYATVEDLKADSSRGPGSFVSNSMFQIAGPGDYPRASSGALRASSKWKGQLTAEQKSGRR